MPDKKIEVATLGGGCFWCLEAVFEQVVGVQSVVSGYAGGKTQAPTYQDICTGTTGHAEVVQISFAPDVINYATILEVFFAIHDPTSLNRQGNDVGTQYRSVIFYHSEEQKTSAETVMTSLRDDGDWSDPLVTQLLPLPTFYRAEDYHQNYFARNPNQGYCQFVVAPKVAKFRQQFRALFRTHALDDRA